MSISKPYRECIVKVNKGSGCLVQPESDKYTYIFTAKHVLYKDREMAEQISPIVIQYKEGVKLNYLKQYEHPDKDIDAAVICVKKIDKWKSPKIDATGLQDGDKVKLCGFPAIRAKKEAGNQQDALDLEVYFDNNEGSILFARGKTLPVKDEVAGFSGGGVFQPTGKDLVLRGIEIQMHSGETPTGKIDFLHISTFLDIIEHYKLPGFKQKAFAHEDTARELLAVVKTRITEKLMQEDFIQFLPYLRTEYRVSTGTGKEQAAKEIAGRITPEKNLDSLFILLKCFNKYKEIRRDPDHLLWVKKTLKDIAAWKLITMINKEFYHGYKIENKKEGIHIDLGFRDEFYVDGFFVELSISGLYKKKPELGDPYTVVDPEAYIPKVSVHTNKMVPILESGPSKPGFIHCVLYSLYTHYLYGEPAEYNESMIRSERVLNFIRTRLEADNTANTPIFIFLGSQYKFTIDVKKALVSDLKRLLPALNVFGFTVAEDSFLIHSPAYVIDNISKFLHDLNEA